MNEFENQWAQLSPFGHSGGRLRVYPDHCLDLFLDFSLSGKRELIIEVKGLLFEPLDIPNFQNLELVYRQIDGGVQIGVTLLDDTLIKSFSIMCFDLAERSKLSSSAAEGFLIIVDVLRKWAELFKFRKTVGLSRSETIGLFGELLIIQDLLFSFHENVLLIVQSWRGPHGDQRDIGFNGARIEVKSQLSTQSVSLAISSLEQLDDRGNGLIVALNRLSVSESGITLDELIMNIVNLLSINSFALIEFERKIELTCYQPNTCFSTERFGIDEKLFFKVASDFPRLIPATVPNGIKNVTYQISGPSLMRHQISWSELIGNLNA